MDTMHLRAFQRQIVFQCKCALMAADDIDRGVAKSDTQLIFFSIQNLLNAAANISKAFIGFGGRERAAREPLRRSLGVDDKSPLMSVAMRNNFEHMDERIDRWWSKSSRHNKADFCVGKIPMIAGLEDVERFREYDPTTGDIVFWGQAYNLRDIVKQISILLPVAECEASKPHWDP